MHYVLTCLAALAFGVLPGAEALAASLVGSWKGTGVAKLKSGKEERVRCTIRYEEGTGRTFVLYVTCAHTNGTFKNSGRIVQLSETSYRGSMYSDQYNVSGDVTLTVNGNRQTLNAVSPKGTATVTLTKQ